ncbi:L,D-transpeptidase [Salinimicrobium xinjiangense]|uniref:L,D-transpeptidase n=1 Tax=Salinimicrobium xinjiangense TaxID=438596 RepID=UPI0006840D45|nr:L,D-transpeptidase [Salinimicrobium xinjiangense]
MKIKRTYLQLFILVAFVITTGVTSCERSQISPELPELAENRLSPQQEEGIMLGEERQLPFLFTYHIDSISTSASVDSFKQKYTAPQQELIFALNRLDPDRLQAGRVLIIPDTLTSDLKDYSPFPAYFEMLDSIPKTLLISRRVQGFALYEYGNLKNWGPISSGKRSTPTPVGLFYGNYKALRKVSTVNDSWIMPYYFNFMNFEGVGVHQYAMPGYPASHACVRLRMEDAQFIYNWADQWKLDPTGQVIIRNGTPFMVYGNYDFDARVPWLDLADNHNSNFMTAEEMGILKEYSLQYKMDKRNFDTPALPAGTLQMSNREGLEELQ